MSQFPDSLLGVDQRWAVGRLHGFQSEVGLPSTRHAGEVNVFSVWDAPTCGLLSAEPCFPLFEQRVTIDAGCWSLAGWLS